MIAVIVASLSMALDPAFTKTIEVFHVNPLRYGAAPVNMDTADINGDAFFDLRSVATPLECANQSSSHPGSDCSNPEVTSHDLVITKLLLDVDTRFGQYGMCNICVNGSAGISGTCSIEGEYVCSCHGHGGSSGYTCWHDKCYESHFHTEYANLTACEAKCGKAEVEAPMTSFEHAMVEARLLNDQAAFPSSPCNASVGQENVTEFFGRMSCREGSPAWECWRDAVSKKTGGLWYSTTDKGYCGDGTSPEPANCTWRVNTVVKIVNKTCSDNSIYNAIEKYDAAGSGCFQGAACPVGLKRNTSSACWINCFYETLLGPDAGKPGGEVTGWPLGDLLAAWQSPFKSDDVSEGGCPNA